MECGLLKRYNCWAFECVPVKTLPFSANFELQGMVFQAMPWRIRGIATAADSWSCPYMTRATFLGLVLEMPAVAHESYTTFPAMLFCLAGVMQGPEQLMRDEGQIHLKPHKYQQIYPIMQIILFCLFVLEIGSLAIFRTKAVTLCGEKHPFL